MKFIHLLPPALAVLIVGAGIGYKRWDVGRLEAENAALLKQAAAADRAENDPKVLFLKDGNSRKLKPVFSRGKWNWDALAEMVGKRRNGGVADYRAMRGFEECIAANNSEELAATIEEILLLDLPQRVRLELISEFFDRLGRKDPELALRRFFGRAPFNRFQFPWEKWLEKDPAAATAWFDEQIANGKTEGKRLDGSDASRIPFEGDLIKRLFTSDPAAAVARLEKLPPATVENLGRSIYPGNLDVAAQKMLADFYRSRLGEKESTAMLANGMQHYVNDDDFSKDDAYMERIGATAAERKACINHTMENWCHSQSYDGKVTIARIENLRSWMENGSPGSSEALTRNVIGEMLRGNQQSKMTLEQVEEIVDHYQALPGGEAALVDALTRNSGNLRKEYVVKLAARISDEQQRAKILKQIQND